MSQRGDQQWVADILAAADGLTRRLEGLAYDDWAADDDLRLITERLVEIVGGARRAMPVEFHEQVPEIDWAGFVGLRNVLIHAYHRIQPDLL